MADNNIGKASVLLSASSTLDKDFAHADSQAMGFVNSLKTKMASIQNAPKAISDAFLSAIAAIRAGLTLLMAHPVLLFIAAITIAITAVVGAFTVLSGKATEVFDTIRDHARSAMMVGLGTNSFETLMAGTRTDADTLTVALSHMQREIAAFANGGQEATQVFDRLHISLSQLNGLTTAEQFLVVREAIRGMTSESQQAAAAQALLGRAGREFLPSIRGELEANTARARELGLVVSDDVSDAIKKLGKTSKDTENIWKGFWTQLSIAAMPLWSELTNGMNEMVNGLRPVLGVMVELVRNTASIVAAIIHSVRWLIEHTPGMSQIMGILRWLGPTVNTAALANHANDLRDNLVAQQEQIKHEFAPLAIFGSQENAKMILQSQFGGPQNNPVVDQLTEANRHLAAIEQQRVGNGRWNAMGVWRPDFDPNPPPGGPIGEAGFGSW